MLWPGHDSPRYSGNYEWTGSILVVRFKLNWFGGYDMADMIPLVIWICQDDMYLDEVKE